MRALSRTVLLAAIAAAVAAAPADAVTRCAGESTYAYVCVTTPGVGTRTDTLCVYTGGSSCTPVPVILPTTSGSVGVGCGGSLLVVFTAC